MSKQYNLNKSKEAKGYYIDITRPYEQVAQDIIKLNPNAANKKYIINGTGNHSLKEWVENHKNEGHTLIDATPPVKQQPLNNQDNNTSAEEVSKEDFSGNRDISSSVYNEHFDRGNTFVDPSSNKYMDIKQRLRWDNAEAKNRAFNRQADLVFGGALYGGAGMYAAGAAAPLITTTFAPGTVGGNILGDPAGMVAIDETSKALTGRTTGQHIGDALGLAEDSNWRYAVDFANPINIAGPKLLNRGVSSGVRYAGKLSKDLEKAFKPAIDFYKSGRLRGMYDAAKYGLYDRAGEFAGSLVGGSIAVPKLNPRITKINQKISTGARNLIAPYQKAFNYFSKNFNNIGPSLGINTSRAFSLLKSPSKVKVFMEFPDFYEAIPSYDWGKYSARQFKNFANIYKQEAEKQKFYSGEFGPLKSINPGSTEMQIKNAFEQARNIQHYVDFAERYGKYRGNLYNKYYAELSKDAVWKSILDESPQYMDDIVQFIKSGGTDKEQFVKDLIKKSNSYRRQMPQNFNEDQWLTLNGKSNSRRNVGSIDVEGANRSGDYGKYSGWFEGQPTITGPIETWWSQRIPQGVSRYRGMHSIDNIPPKFYNMLNKEDAELQGISAFFNGYDSTGAPGAYISQPWHQVFVGPIGSRLPNFKVTLSQEQPEWFQYGRGYKTGGKLISKHRRQQNR